MSSSERYKGHDMVLDALRILIADGIKYDIHYDIVGQGNDKNRLMEKAAECGLSEYVCFHGFLNDIDLQNLYIEADVFVMPSRTLITKSVNTGEGFGIVFLEAANYQTALIGAASSGSDDIIIDGYNGYRIDADSTNDLVSTLRKYYRDRKLCAQHALNAKSYIERFNIQNYRNRLREILD